MQPPSDCFQKVLAPSPNLNVLHHAFVFERPRLSISGYFRANAWQAACPANPDGRATARFLRDAGDKVSCVIAAPSVLEDGDSFAYCVENLVFELYHRIMKHELHEDFAGAEWWLQSYEGGRGLGFHFDKDEHAMADQKVMQHPQFSSILYLTGTAASPRQAPTVVLKQIFDPTTQAASPEDPDQCVLVFPCKDNFLVFDGTLGHGVLDSTSTDVRMTLLINWWNHRPQSIQRITPADISQHSLTAWCPAEGQGTTLSVQTIDGMQTVDVLESDDAIQQVDDVLADAKISVSGPGALHWVALHHPGLALYPTADQLMAAGEHADCAAACVPLSALADPDSSSSSDEER